MMIFEWVWVGFDLGGMKMFVVVYDEEFCFFGCECKKIKGSEGSEVGFQRIEFVIEEVLEKVEVDKD